MRRKLKNGHFQCVSCFQLSRTCSFQSRLYLHTLVFIFFGFYLSFIVFFIRPLSGGDKRSESGESRDGVGEGGGVNAHIAPTSSFEVVALYFFLFMRAIGDIKVGQLLNPGMRIYDGVFVIIPQGKVANKQQHGKQQSTSAKMCLVYPQALYSEARFRDFMTSLSNTPTCFMHICKKSGGGPKSTLLWPGEAQQIVGGRV